jgi:xylan 1,4-beta-xylosidase
MRIRRRRLLAAPLLAAPLAGCGGHTLDVVVQLDAGAEPIGLVPGPSDVTVTVDWGRPTAETATGLHYGLSLVRGHDPEIAGAPGNPVYKENLALMRPGLARLASFGWLLEPDRPTYRWDAEKIRQALSGALPHGPAWMINVPVWPSALGDPKQPLAAERFDAFATLCADLVRILNVDQRRGVRYVELFNAVDGFYKDRGAELGLLFRRASRAMKAIDPAIRVGGAAFTHAYHPMIDPFVEAAGDALDFVSYHGYATGDRAEALAKIYDAPMGFAASASHVANVLVKRGRGGAEIFQTQFNINWAKDDRMTGAVSAVFDALAFHAFVASPLAGAAAWNESDGWYGKLDASHRMRPAAYVFQLYNAHLVGAVVATTTSLPAAISPLAVRDGGSHALALVNRDDAFHDVELRGPAGAEPFPAPITLHRVTGVGLRSGGLPPAGGPLVLRLPPASVSVLVASR